MRTVSRVSDRELQNKFNNNEGGYPARINELRRQCIYDKPAHPSSNQPPGIRSKLYKYFDGQEAVMYLHCFELPSGELGASKRMDPKRLLVGDTFYYCD